MNCTPEQCAELEALMAVLQAEYAVIQAEASVLQAEMALIENDIATVIGCMDYCECGGAMKASEEKKTTDLTPEMKARVQMLLRISRSVRRDPPAASGPKQV